MSEIQFDREKFDKEVNDLRNNFDYSELEKLAVDETNKESKFIRTVGSITMGVVGGVVVYLFFFFF